MGAYLAVKLRIIFCMHTRNNETHTQDVSGKNGAIST